MTKSEYFAKITRCLQWGMQKDELYETMDDFAEIFRNEMEDGKSEEEIIASMGTVENVRANLISEQDKRRERNKMIAFIIVFGGLLIPTVHNLLSGNAYMLFFEVLVVFWVISGDPYRNYNEVFQNRNDVRQILMYQAGACLIYATVMTIIYYVIPHTIIRFEKQGNVQKVGLTVTLLLSILLIVGFGFWLGHYFFLWRYYKPLYGCIVLYFSIIFEVLGYYFHMGNSASVDVLMYYHPWYWVCTLSVVLLYYVYCYFNTIQFRGQCRWTHKSKKEL